MRFHRHARGRGLIPPTFATILASHHLVITAIWKDAPNPGGRAPSPGGYVHEYRLAAEVEAWLTANIPSADWHYDAVRYPCRLFIRGENNALAFQMRWG